MSEPQATMPAPAWRRVLGEIVIIVLGVLIALAVSDWARGRDDRALERRYLERLRADAAHNVAALDAMVASSTQRAATLAAYDAWIAGEGPMPDAAVLQDTLCRWFIPPTPQWHDETYAELIASGNFAVVRDERLRMALSRAAALFRRGQALDRNTDAVVRAIGPLERHRTWYLDPALADGSACRFDHDALRADAQTRSMLAQLHRERVIYRLFHTDAREAVRAVIARIDELQPGPP
jgi:type II secretory pathway pseudopilin PulG